MKKVLSIFIAAVFLFSTSSFTLSRHFCGGNLYSTHIFITKHTASCGMHMMARHHYKGKTAVDYNCCKNILQTIKVEGQSQISLQQLKIIIPTSGTAIFNIKAPLPLVHYCKTLFTSSLHPPNVPIYKLVAVFLR